MRIRLITSSGADFAAWYGVFQEAHGAEYPSGPRLSEQELTVAYEDNDYHLHRIWLAEDGGEAVGAAVLRMSLSDNLTLGEPEVWVRPRAQRRGIGTALLGEIEAAAGENGRTSLMTYLEGPTSAPETSGTRFAERHGFTRRITEIARVQRPPFDLDGIAKAEEAARPHAAGYQILTWQDPTPEEHVDEYARMEARLSVDAPLGELDYEGEAWDAARIRASEERAARMRRGAWSAVALAADGTMAGMTRITLVHDSDEIAFQDSTLVDPVHRGHRLGLLVKAANLRALLRDRPGVQAIWTWNADSNTHMIGINETLGYRIAGWSAGYQRDLS